LGDGWARSHCGMDAAAAGFVAMRVPAYDVPTLSLGEPPKEKDLR
jgi:hypothetical protein